MRPVVRFLNSLSIERGSRGCAAVILAAIALVLSLPLCAEMPRPLPPRDYLPSHIAVQSAGMIFSGTVLKVEHLRSAGFPGVTQVTFRVESAMRGTRNGRTLMVREWAGLWSSGERYRSGERVLLFLYPKSKLGLTSPVGGPSGRYEVDHAGRVLAGGPEPRPQPIRIQDFAAEIRRTAQEQ